MKCKHPQQQQEERAAREQSDARRYVWHGHSLDHLDAEAAEQDREACYGGGDIGSDEND